MPWKMVHVLLVEDDEIDAEHILRSFRRQEIKNPVTVVHNGFDALGVLLGAEGYERIPRPYIILLDLNMPRMNGMEFLQIVRQDQELRRSVIFVLTTSNRKEDIEAAYDANIAGYFLKSNAFDESITLPQMLSQYWQLVQLPPPE